MGIKSLNNAKIAMGLFLVLLVIAVIILARNSAFPRQASHDLFRYLTGQEVSIKTAGFKEIQTRHYIIKYEPVDEAYIGLIGDTAEEAYTTVTDMFGREPVQKTTVIVYPDSRSLARSFGWDKDEKALGVYWGGTIRILSPREWVQGEDKQTIFRKEGPMVHELTHLMVDDITRGNYNRWWTEGIAQYVEKKTTGFEFVNPFTNGRNLEYYQFAVLDKKFDSLDQQIAYWQSLKAIEFINNQYGEDSLFEILDYLGRGDSMAGAVKKALGLDYQAFESSFIQNLNNAQARCTE